MLFVVLTNREFLKSPPYEKMLLNLRAPDPRLLVLSVSGELSLVLRHVVTSPLMPTPLTVELKLMPGSIVANPVMAGFGVNGYALAIAGLAAM